jgi:hypothetical protein
MILLCSNDIHRNPGPVNDNQKNLQICHMNIRSITAPNRLEDLSDYIQTIHDFDIIALTETHLKPTTPDSAIHIENYNTFRKDRLHKPGGGVALYVSENFHCTHRPDLEPLTSEIMWCEVIFKNHKLLFCVVYRPPNQTADEIELFINDLQTSIDLAVDCNPYAISVLGDLNDRCTVWDSDHTNSELKNKLVDLLKLNNLHQLIMDPTRDENILDLIITDAPNYYLSTGVIPSLSNLDHDAIFGNFVFSYKKPGSYARHVWQYARGDYATLNNLIFDTIWHTDIHDVDDLENCVDHLTTKVLSYASECIPNGVVNIKPRDKPWFTNGLRKLLRERDRLHKRQKLTKNDIHKKLYKNKRREATDACRQAKTDYYDKMTDRLHDPTLSSKNYWKLIKSAMGNKQSMGIPTMMENDVQIQEDQDKATILNDYFISQTKLPNTNVPLPPFDYITEARLDHIEITPVIVRNILLKLDVSKATGPDEISNKILKECASSICFPLSELFKKSLELGIFPSSWKEAMVTAIFKKQNRQLKANYRPISLLSCISKVFERIIYNTTYNYFRSNHLLNIHNSGFQRDDSAILRLLSLTDSIYQGLDNHDEILLVFLDVSKAFDRVWHKGLLYKLKQAGIHGALLSWFESYLLNRRQRVVVAGKSSNTKHTSAGVPQGSILGPLMFLLYISDLSSNLESRTSLFADDTTIIKHIDTNPHLTIASLNADLDRLQRWADLWKITFNPLKTVFIRVSNKLNKPPLNPLYLNRVVIREVDHYPNLGLIYSNKMDWKFHLENIARKVALRMAYLKRLQFNLPRSALTRIYLTMIRPIIEYGDIIYDNINISQTQTLEKIQRRAALICTGAYRHTEHRLLLDELGWDTLAERRKQHRLIAYFKIINGQAPAHLIASLPQTVENQSHYNLRNRDNLRPRFSRLKLSLHSFFPNTTRDWNKLPLATRESLSLNIFKHRISFNKQTNPYFAIHRGRAGMWLARIRMGLSGLNSHRFTYNMIPSPTCPLCLDGIENTLHYLWVCPAHTEARDNLKSRIETELGIQTGRENIIPICIQGVLEKKDHQKLYNIVIEYIKHTARFR